MPGACSEITDARKTAFLEALAGTGNITDACRVAKVSRSSIYLHRDADPDFAKAWDDALEEAADGLEAKARRRAMGYDEPFFYQGKECGKITRYSDQLLQFLLRGVRPDKYADRKKIDADLRHHEDWLAHLDDDDSDGGQANG